MSQVPLSLAYSGEEVEGGNSKDAPVMMKICQKWKSVRIDGYVSFHEDDPSQIYTISALHENFKLLKFEFHYKNH